MIKCNICGKECQTHLELANHIIKTIEDHNKSLAWAVSFKTRPPQYNQSKNIEAVSK